LADLTAAETRLLSTGGKPRGRGIEDKNTEEQINNK
jgi:hypothetical protein